MILCKIERCLENLFPFKKGKIAPETKQIQNTSPMEFEPIIPSETSDNNEVLGIFLDKLNNRFDYKGNIKFTNNKINGTIEDPFGKSEIIDGKIKNGILYFKKNYTEDKYGLASPEYILYTFKKILYSNKYVGSYYYIHNDNLSIDQLIELSDNCTSDKDISFGGKSLILWKETINENDIKIFTDISTFPSPVTNIFETAAKIRETITHNQRGTAREYNNSNLTVCIRNKKNRFSFIDNMHNINLTNAFLGKLIDLEKVRARRANIT